ncbi:hypothetical protein GCM10010420_43080 [Streptomyces glaucosporus]|uniref:MmpS family membrane protein n=1 Tax=Streptomyces glaucosporus TaxID=284044 RepID=A0ABP5VRH1_9ACTN
MRRKVTGLALAAAAALLAGCGGGGGEDTGAEPGKKDGAAEASARPSAGDGQQDGGAEESSDGASGGSSEDGAEGGSGGSGGGEVTREVTLEVGGDGRTQVFYTADTNKTEQVTLPWSKTVELSLTPAEQKVGVLVTIVPGSVQGDDGQLTAASCVIKVDGKKVDDNGDGKDVSGCKYKVK